MRFRTESHGIYLDTDGNAPYSLRCPLIYLVEQAMIQLVDGNLFFYKKALPPSVLSLSVWGWRVHSLYRIRQACLES